jgi:delta 1-pyrroline-5-carboxylate dehydrogenase
MSKMMKFGNGLQKKYTNQSEDKPVSDADKNQKKKDHEALRKYHESKRAQREARMEHRDANKKTVTEYSKEQIELVKKDKEERLEQLEENKENKIERQVKEAKEKTNHLARKHGLEEPNNPEALAHDRLHCYKCDMKLHIPDAYKELPEDVQLLLGRDKDIRHLCCFCFGKMEDGEIIKLQENSDSDKKIRMMVYNPEGYVRDNAEEIHKEDIKQVEHLTKERIMYYNSKIKKYEGVVSLIGNVKHNDLEDEEHTELSFLKQFPTRYDYANN